MEGREPKVDGKWFARKDARPRRSGPVRFIRTCLVLFAILYLGVWLLGFTAGFRSYLEDDLQRRLGLPVKIRKAHLTPDLNLVVEGLATEGSGRKGQPGVAVQKGRLEWTLLDDGRWHWPPLAAYSARGLQPGLRAGGAGRLGTDRPDGLQRTGGRLGRLRPADAEAGAAAGGSRTGKDRTGQTG